jgi:CDP-glucose 4,6-dehydratase
MTASNKFWKDRRVFVTGATGLVGSWVTRELVDRGAKVVALVMDADPQSELYRSGYIHRVHVVNGLLEDFSALERGILAHECETVFHLGAQAIVSVAARAPLPTFETNVRGTWNLLEVCRLHPDLIKRVVVASSDKAYGESDQLPYTEDLPLRGRQPYEASKSCADLVAQSYAHTYNLPVAIARCGNIYGGGDLNWTRIVPSAIRSFHFGESPLLRSDGQYLRDYIYVKDAVDSYLTLAEQIESPQVHGEGFNFSPESQVTVMEIVHMIGELMGCQSIHPTIQNFSKNEIRSQYLSSEKAYRVLNWRAKYSLEKGLNETISWYREFFDKQQL